MSQAELLDSPESTYVIPDYVPEHFEKEPTSTADVPETYAATALAQMRAYNKQSREQSRLSAKSIMAGMESFENRLDTAAKNSAQKSIAKSEAKGRGEKSTRRRAASREMLVKSGPYALIGATAFVGTVLTGGGTALVGGAFAARTAVRTSRGVHRGSQNLEQGNELTAKMESDSDSKWVQRGIKLANTLSAPERKATEAALNFMRSTDKEVTERRRLIAHSIGAVAGGVAMFGAGKLARTAAMYADRHMVGTAKAQTSTTETNPTGGAAAPAETATTTTPDSPFGLEVPPSLSGTETTPPATETTPRGGGTPTPEASGKGGPNGNGSLDPSGADPFRPSGSTDPANYNRFENHEGSRMASNIDYDWKNASPAERDMKLRETMGNRPSLLASAMEIRESGRLGFSEADVNERIGEYTVAGQNGVYSDKGLEALETFKESWGNGKRAELMSDKDVRDLQSRYILENHETNEGKFKNAIDDEVSIAGNLNYHPELGDQLMMKEMGDGRVICVKVNFEDPSRHCNNIMTLREKPAGVDTFGITSSQPENIVDELKPNKGHDYVIKFTPQPDVTPEEETTPDITTTTPPPTTTTPPPPTQSGKDPSQDINVNPHLPEQVGMGDQAGTIPAGPVTTNPQTPPPVYEAPSAPAPVQTPNPNLPPVETPAPTPTNPGGTTTNPF